jgi:PAS domain S-box-containing protein
MPTPLPPSVPDTEASAPVVNILLVDDQLANLLALRTILESLGQHLVDAHSGEEALRLLAERDFAVVLLDVQMHGMDGYETAQLIRSHERSRHTPIIFLTAHEDNRFPVEHAYALGAVDYLVKPLVPKILLCKVGIFVELFQKTRQVQELQRQKFDRTLAEEDARLRQSEERFTRFMQHLPGLAWIKDMQGRYLYANDAAVKAFRTTRADLYGKTDDEVFPPATAAQFRENDRGALATEAGVLVIETLAHEDGIVHQSVVSKFAIPGPDNQPVLVGGMAIDITDRLRAVALLNTLQDNAPVGFAFVDREFRFVRINEALAAINGKPAADHFGRTVQEIIPHLWPSLEPLYRRVLEGGEPVTNREVSGETAAAPGQVRHWLVSYYPVCIGSEITGIGVVVSEITERKRAEEALRVANQNLQIVTDSMSAPVIRCSRDLRYLWVNRYYAQWFGRPAEEFVGRRIIDVLSKEAFDQLRPHFDEVLAGKDVQYEAEVNYRGADLRWIKAMYTPTLDASGQPDGWVAVVLDITDSKRQEEALREADRKKDEFLAILAHELRNPLAPLRNGLQVMKLAKNKAEAFEQSCAMMERQLGQMVRLIDDLLDVSRISRGMIVLRKERVELAKVVQGAVETSRPLIDRSSHELTLRLPEEPVYVDADRTRLAQALSNLLSNAAKYTDRGGHIWMTVEREGNDSVISVKDTGIGIPASMLPKVFEMFTQMDRSLEKSQGGLGIGLTIVKRLVEMHGGSVEVRSEGHGMGSEFIIRLPVVLSIVHGREEDGDHQPAQQKARRRILVVDDNVDAASSLALMLKMMGNDVRTAHDGLEAVEEAAAFRPELVLLDIGMPKVNGYDACRRIREQPGGKNIVIVALTGWGQDEDKRRSQEAGFNIHLVKPVEPAVLEQLLAELKSKTG